MLSIKENKSKKLEAALAEQLKKDLDAQIENEDELFVLAEYDETAAEKTGYSNYSYWRSTLQVFLKNKVAVFLLIVLASLLAFTFIQPHLPGQYPANLINNNPQTGKQLSNVAPSLTTVIATAPAGTELRAKAIKGNDEWFAVDNVMQSLKARTKFDIIEYGEVIVLAVHLKDVRLYLVSPSVRQTRDSCAVCNGLRFGKLKRSFPEVVTALCDSDNRLH